MSHNEPLAAVVGVGSTAFGTHTQSTRALAIEAVDRALDDAGMDPAVVGAAFYGYSITGLIEGQESCVGQLSLRDLGITGIPINRIENACSSSAAAMHVACQAVRAGDIAVALVFGVERMTSGGTARAIMALAGASDMTWEGQEGLTFPGTFGMIAQRHMLEYGTSREQIAKVAVKNHEHGLLNDGAHFKARITVDDVLNSKPIADPLRLLDCCPISDGATAAIVVRPDLAARFDTQPVFVWASALASGVYDDAQPMTSFAATKLAATRAYEDAGIGPDDLDLAEVHDCFTIAELIHYEDLGFCAPGESGKLIDTGATRLDGRIPVNVSGGLKSKGHPVGATGVGQIVEVTRHLRSQAGQRQVDGARTALTHCLGGFFHGDAGAATVHILSN